MSEPVTVVYAPASQGLIDFQRSLVADLSFEDALQHLRDAIEALGFWILHEINPQELLSRGGYSIRPARQILFFHPRFVARILGIDPAALLEAPLKFAVLEGPEGRAMVRWFAPEQTFARYRQPLLTELGEELANMCAAIVARLVGEGVVA